MSETILLLSEDSLTTADVEHITALHTGEDVRYHVLVPADTERNLLVSLVDHLSMGELREALDDVLGREPSPVRARATAEDQLAASVAALVAAGVRADGVVVADDPLPALRAAVKDATVREVVVVTQPHALEDTFHTDWASRAREELHVPVLHLYSGTSQLG
ncbi:MULTISPECIES: hypothetical protein [unclassified Actinotalea]|uniref:hypothetical protein n=1 Tax=unclassified Actinotalea TaxID=2638618 RepID=UPI0015F5979B|nr:MULTISPECIES: hypothetical protein [unclassified Actinotalea]